MQVTLSNGTVQEIDELTPDELLDLQWQEERAFARRIRQSSRGSEERARAFREGYDTVTQLMAARLADNDEQSSGLVMGFGQRYARLIGQLLARYERRGVAHPRMFEIGYGSGAMLAAVAARGYEVAGIEVSRHMREQACARLPETVHPRLQLGDFLTLDEPAGSYDVIYWNDVFEHLPPDENLDYLRKIHDLLRPGGTLVTLTPNWHLRPADISFLFNARGSEPEGFHLKEYTTREMTRLLRTAGFRRVRMPLVVLPSQAVLLGGGLRWLKCQLEPLLEYVPYCAAKLACRGLAMNCTLAVK